MNSTERRDYRERIEELREETRQLKEKLKKPSKLVDWSEYPTGLFLPFPDMRLFLCLYKQIGKVVTHFFLVHEFVNFSADDPKNALGARISKLRKHIAGKYEIVNVYGEGYLLYEINRRNS